MIAIINSRQQVAKCKIPEDRQIERFMSFPESRQYGGIVQVLLEYERGFFRKQYVVQTEMVEIMEINQG